MPWWGTLPTVLGMVASTVGMVPCRGGRGRIMAGEVPHVLGEVNGMAGVPPPPPHCPIRNTGLWVEIPVLTYVVRIPSTCSEPKIIVRLLGSNLTTLLCLPPPFRPSLQEVCSWNRCSGTPARPQAGPSLPLWVLCLMTGRRVP